MSLPGSHGFLVLFEIPKHTDEFCMSLSFFSMALPNEWVSLSGHLKSQRLDVASSAKVGENLGQMLP
jgi:hypothetical protein